MSETGDSVAGGLDGREAGDLFRRDLEEARVLARSDDRFDELARALAVTSLAGRMRAIDGFFESFDRSELAGLDLPPCLGQLRSVYLRSQ